MSAEAWCCVIGCTKPAEYRAWAMGSNFEDYTDMCSEHVLNLFVSNTLVAPKRWEVNFLDGKATPRGDAQAN